MKKLMLISFAALAFVGCVKNDVTPLTQQEIDKQKYDQAFRNYLEGKSIPSSQDWGFSADITAETTRGTVDVNSNEWEQKGYVIPAAITQREVDVVSAWFASNRYPQSEPLDVSDFFVQNVYAANITYNTETDGKNDNNGTSHSENGSAHMDYISCSNKAGTWDHINNFNANSGQIQHLLNSGTYAFSFHDSYGDYTSQKFVLRAISVDGVVGYYVGFDYESYGKSDGSEFHADGYYTDRIIKIVPGKIVPTGNIRIIAEDLSAAEDGDFDFNDIVLDVKFGGNAQLILHAAGGTLPLRVGGKDEWEVHQLFGVGQNQMVNTGAGPEKDPVVFDYGSPINNGAEANNIKIEVFKNGAWQTLTAQKGEPTSKLAVDKNYKWLGERQSIKKEYPTFVEWATNANFKSKWW